MKPFLYHCLIRGLLIEAASGFYRPGERFLSTREVRKTYFVSAATAIRAMSLLVQEGIIETRERCPHVLTVHGIDRARILLPRFPAPEIAQKVRMGKVWNQLKSERWMGRRIALIDDHFSSDSLLQRIRTYPIHENASKLGSRWANVHFFREMIRLFYEVDFYFNQHTEKSYRELVETLALHRVSGVAVFRYSQSFPASPLLKLLKEKRIPSVVVFGDCEEIADAAVDFNNTGAGYKAVETFAQRGHRRILVVMRKDAAPRFMQRAQGAKSYIENHPDVHVHVAHVLNDGTLPARTMETFRHSRTRPTAIFCTGLDRVKAIAKQLKREGLRIPKEVSMIGCGVPEWVRPVSSHSYNCLYQDFGLIGQTAAQNLHRVIEKESVPRISLLDMPYIRGSSIARVGRKTEKRCNHKRYKRHKRHRNVQCEPN